MTYTGPDRRQPKTLWQRVCRVMNRAWTSLDSTRTTSFIVAASTAILLASLGFAVLVIGHRTQRLGECVLAQLTEARQNNYAHNRESASHHRYPFLTPGGEPPAAPTLQQLETACRNFTG